MISIYAVRARCAPPTSYSICKREGAVDVGEGAVDALLGAVDVGEGAVDALLGAVDVEKGALDDAEGALNESAGSG